MKLHIIYRICDKPTSVSGIPRPLNLTKKQVIGCCLPSLVDSFLLMGESCGLTVLADDLTDETKEYLKQVTSKLSLVDIQHFNPSLKPIGSLLKAYEIADSITDNPDDTWVYFCEDDFLHDKSTFLVRFFDFVALMNARSLALPTLYHPSDNPLQYGSTIARSYIYQSATGYFREVNHSTKTFICQLKTYQKLSKWLKECAIDEDKFASAFKKSTLCFSPIPGTTTHLHEGLMSNYIDWQKIIYTPTS
jgi:hypothetical protein